ncbi:two-component system response regulator AlgR [Natronocella acetinitrilica]|uniref:Two-component system response regulator AlgR n=1 Tax=Natronocella acetinitrilica TaxID=414046 RepID=A0AAE3G249_9GAMM|nr:LytTR family DNA-binding domain-containing protein [Natronocella acetinitrilica]MCP1673331.1 two-component system response regulator AlgR [Natronocella acetinitrilica]
MRVLIVDDEAPARERLAQLISDLGEHQVVGGARNGEEAVALAERHRPDVVLMDIRMPGMDGLAAASKIGMQEAPPAVIFVTAFGEHALEAFDARGADYLVKPVRLARLQQALQRAQQLNRAQLDALQRVEADAHSGDQTHLLCRRRGNLELIPLQQVYYLQAEHKYVTVRHADGEDLIEDSLRTLEERFPAYFVRVHRNALVALDRLTGLEKDMDGRRYAILRGLEERLEVSRRHVADLRRLLRERAGRG